MIYFGFKILYDKKIFCEIIFRKEFDPLEIKSIIDDIYSNLHTSRKYEFFMLDENKDWELIDGKFLYYFLNNQKFDDVGYMSD